MTPARKSTAAGKRRGVTRWRGPACGRQRLMAAMKSRTSSISRRSRSSAAPSSGRCLDLGRAVGHGERADAARRALEACASSAVRPCRPRRCWSAHAGRLLHKQRQHFLLDRPVAERLARQMHQIDGPRALRRPWPRRPARRRRHRRNPTGAWFFLVRNNRYRSSIKLGRSCGREVNALREHRDEAKAARPLPALTLCLNFYAWGRRAGFLYLTVSLRYGETRSVARGFAARNGNGLAARHPNRVMAAWRKKHRLRKISTMKSRKSLKRLLISI